MNAVDIHEDAVMETVRRREAALTRRIFELEYELTQMRKGMFLRIEKMNKRLEVLEREHHLSEDYYKIVGV